MALSRRSSGRFQSAIWPGFVDAMTGLLLVLMFVLTIFMVIQFVLRETISGQESELDNLSNELSFVSAALGATRAQSATLATSLGEANAEISSQASRIADLPMTLALEEKRREAEETLTLLAAAETARQGLDTELAALLLAKQAVELELADIEATQQTGTLALETVQAELSDALAENAQLQAQLAALAGSQAANEADRADLAAQLAAALALAETANETAIQSASAQLNTALARVAAEERRARALEEAEAARLAEEAARLAAEAQNLERFRSDFFGQVREVLEGQDRIRIEGDRFVFSSEVLFEPGQATLSAQGRAEIANIASILRDIADDIPAGIDWIIRVDGHTDNIPLGGSGRFRDNWELSQGRALSVVRYMTDFLGIPPQRLAANGFGQYQPLNPADTVEARAQNRRIELKLTER